MQTILTDVALILGALGVILDLVILVRQNKTDQRLTADELRLHTDEIKMHIDSTNGGT